MARILEHFGSFHWLCLVLLPSILACTQGGNLGPEQASPNPANHLFLVREGNISKHTKIFLVAGSYDSANFAQAVIDQKRLWLGKGYSESEIACYFAPPPTSNPEDIPQFLSLADDLSSCFFADWRIIKAHLQFLAQARPDSIYFFATAHGSAPPSDPLRGSVSQTESNGGVRQETLGADWFGQYTLDISGFLLNNEFKLISSLARIDLFSKSLPGQSDDFLFTPRSFSKVLKLFPSHAKKHVVLSACHSGGFILPSSPERPTLQDVPEVTVLTASSSDRSSFGCNPGNHTTHYDAALHSALAASDAFLVEHVSWENVHSAASKAVAIDEAALGIAGSKRSIPQYFSNSSAR